MEEVAHSWSRDDLNAHHPHHTHHAERRYGRTACTLREAAASHIGSHHQRRAETAAATAALRQEQDREQGLAVSANAFLSANAAANTHASANNAGGTDRDRKMAERRQKDELVGKILAHYQARGQDPPIGLPASDVETLRKHLAHVKKEAAAAKGSTARPPQIAL